MAYTYLKQLFCDGSIVNYCEESPRYWNGQTTLKRWSDDGHSSEITVQSGYLYAKMDLMRATGNGHKILKWH